MTKLKSAIVLGHMPLTLHIFADTELQPEFDKTVLYERNMDKLVAVVGVDGVDDIS